MFDPRNPYGAPGGLANMQAPIPGTVPAQPSIAPPSLADFYNGQWTKLQAYLPELTMPLGQNVALQARDYTLSYTFTSTTAQVQNVSFAQPTTLFAISAAAYDTSDADLPVGRNPLDLFRIQIERTNGDRFQTNSVLGSTVCGTGSQPRLVGPSGWMFDIGGTARITITPNSVATLAVDLTLWAVEVRGPANFVWRAVPFGSVGL